MLEYMKDQGEEFAGAAEAFAAATGLEESSGNEGVKGLLERKWTSVVRLQRKVRYMSAKETDWLCRSEMYVCVRVGLFCLVFVSVFGGMHACGPAVHCILRCGFYLVSDSIIV